MNENKFKKIDDINNALSNLNTLAQSTMSDIGEIEGLTQQAVQNIVDGICIRLSNQINEQLNKQRDNLVKILHQQYESATEQIALFKPLIELNIADLPSCINGLKKLISIYTKPYQEAVDFVTILTPKLAELTNNISNLAQIPSSIPPIPNMPNVSFDKLNINMKPINISDIISG